VSPTKDFETFIPVCVSTFISTKSRRSRFRRSAYSARAKWLPILPPVVPQAPRETPFRSTLSASVEAAHRSRYRIRSGDLLCARTGTIGRLALATAEQTGWIFGTGLIRIRPSQQVDPLYLSLYLTHPAVQDWFSRNAGGTAIRNVNTRTLGSLPVSLPPLATQRAIGRTLGALNEKIAAHERAVEGISEKPPTRMEGFYAPGG
jgi:Type I restriction modification DNA specificity domain